MAREYGDLKGKRIRENLLSVATEMLLFQRLSLLSTKADALSFHKGKNNLLLPKLYHAAKVKNKGCGQKESFFSTLVFAVFSGWQACLFHSRPAFRMLSSVRSHGCHASDHLTDFFLLFSFHEKKLG